MNTLLVATGILLGGGALVVGSLFLLKSLAAAEELEKDKK